MGTCIGFGERVFENKMKLAGLGLVIEESATGRVMAEGLNQ